LRPPEAQGVVERNLEILQREVATLLNER